MPNRGHTIQQNSSAFKHDEFGISEIIRLLLRHKIFLAFLITFAFMTVGFQHWLMPSYQARAMLSVQSASSNLMQAMSSRISGFGAGDDEPRAMDRYVVKLRSYEFFLLAADALQAGEDFQRIPASNFSRETPYEKLKNLLNEGTPGSLATIPTRERLAELLTKWTTISSNGSNLVISVSTPSKTFAVFLANFIAEVAKNRSSVKAPKTWIKPTLISRSRSGMLKRMSRLLKRRSTSTKKEAILSRSVVAPRLLRLKVWRSSRRSAELKLNKTRIKA